MLCAVLPPSPDPLPEPSLSIALLLVTLGAGLLKKRR
ncbi:MAG: PEP-CTERM sorting domain-containing protein [Cyanobacteria bacterium SBLK]|nr:PEP-CTERM sorting domain-containing protein [Cyanobacteria bacterium SBLK]